MYKTKEEPGETCFRIAAAEASSANLVVLVDVVRAGPGFVLVQVREVRDGADQRSLPSWLRQAQAQPAPYATLAHPGPPPRVRAMAAGKVSLLCAAPTRGLWALGRRVCESTSTQYSYTVVVQGAENLYQFTLVESSTVRLVNLASAAGHHRVLTKFEVSMRMAERNPREEQGALPRAVRGLLAAGICVGCRA